MIPALYRANVSYLLRHPWPLALAVLGIAIGVAVIVAVDLANESSRKAFLLSMDTVTGAATHQVIGGPGGIDEDAYVSLRTQHGIRSIAPVVQGDVTVNDTAFDVLGIDLFAEQEMREFLSQVSSAGDDGAAAGESLFRGMLTQPGGVILSAAAAEALGLATGDRFDIVASGKPLSAALLGTYASDGASGLDRVLTTDIATAQEWFGLAGKLSRIDVRIDDSDPGLKAHLESLLAAGTTLLRAAARSRATVEMSAAFMTNLTAMSLLALLVGLFLIYNSVSFSVLQRRRLIGILRALGTTRREIFVLVLTETAGIAVFAAAIGIALGVWLGGELLGLVSQSINDFYFRVAVTDVTVSGFSIGKGALAGVGTALIAATVPAIEASGYRPRLAMTRSTLERQTHR